MCEDLSQTKDRRNVPEPEDVEPRSAFRARSIGKQFSLTFAELAVLKSLHLRLDTHLCGWPATKTCIMKSLSPNVSRVSVRRRLTSQCEWRSIEKHVSTNGELDSEMQVLLMLLRGSCHGSLGAFIKGSRRKR